MITKGFSMTVADVLALMLLAGMAVWVFYNVIVMIKSRGKRIPSGRDPPPEDHFISLIIPMKDEESVAERVLQTLINLDYDRYEIVVVEDGSTDRTPEICERFARRYPGLVRYVKGNKSMGKPAALNLAMKQARGDIIGILDADSVPPKDLLRRVVEALVPGVDAVQGWTHVLNEDENLLTKLQSYEEEARFRSYQSRRKLGLFTPLTGSCQFIRRGVIESLGGWDENALAEDAEISLRLLDINARVEHSPFVETWEEVPSSIRKLFKQRVRWFRGWVELVPQALKRLLSRRDLISLDALMVLSTPAELAYLFLVVVLGAIFFIIPMPFISEAVRLAYKATSLIFLALMTLLGTLLTVLIRIPGKILWIPAIYLYWGVQSTAALLAVLQSVFRWPKKWEKTPKTGRTTLGSVPRDFTLKAIGGESRGLEAEEGPRSGPSQSIT